VANGSEHPALEALRARVEEEDAAYAEVLAAIDRLCAFPLPAEAAPEIRERLSRLNELWPAPERPAGGGLGGLLRRRAWDAVAPAVERQAAFDAALVQLLNAYLAQADVLHARLRELAGALVRYAQRVQPLVDARDRVATALATTRSELLLEAFDRRLEGLLAGTAAEDRHHGSRHEIRRRLAEYADLVAGSEPVVDLGGGRGGLLEVLRERGVAARGAEGDLVGFLRAQAEGSLGAVVAAPLAEHLPPPVLSAMLAEAHRALRPGGLLLLEAANPRPMLALAAAAGFGDVRVETRSAVPEDAQLLPVPPEGLPEAAAAALNENVARLNALLCGPPGYALVARR
jgi:SAM-dependent methyltransferase